MQQLINFNLAFASINYYFLKKHCLQFYELKFHVILSVTA